MRIIVWNIGYGFHTMGETPQLELHRQRAAQALIADYRPDMFVAVEACYAEPFNERFVDYKNIFNYQHFEYSTGHWEWHEGVLSNMPFLAETMPLLDRSALRIMVDDMIIDVVHPHPYWKKAEKEAYLEPLIDSAPSNQKYAICGDFNLVHSSDEPVFGGVNSTIWKKMDDQNIKDAFDNDRTPTFPTRMFTPSLQSPSCRIDHFFSRNMKVGHRSVLLDPRADIASDHYPLLIEVY